MIDIPIVVNEDEIKVATFVDQIDVQVDIGPTGDRGTFIFTGIGDPSAKTQPPSPTADPVFRGVSEIKANDLYIDASPGGRWLYVYQPDPINWALVGSLTPTLYTGRHALTFTGGVSTTLSVALDDIIGASSTTLTGDDFAVSVTPVVSGGATTTYLVNPTSVTVNTSNLDLVFHLRAFSTTAVSVPGTVSSLPLLVTIGVIT